MSIQTIQAYKVGSATFHTLGEAKVAAIVEAINIEAAATTTIEAVVNHADEVISILQWNGESSPAKKTRKTRKDKGTKRAEVKPAVVSGSGKYEGK